jgi:hypothetical protein
MEEKRNSTDHLIKMEVAGRRLEATMAAEDYTEENYLLGISLRVGVANGDGECDYGVYFDVRHVLGLIQLVQAAQARADEYHEILNRRLVLTTVPAVI